MSGGFKWVEDRSTNGGKTPCSVCAANRENVNFLTHANHLDAKCFSRYNCFMVSGGAHPKSEDVWKSVHKTLATAIS